MSKIFDWQLVFTEIPSLLKYLPVTIQLTLIALIIGWAAGLFIAIVKIHRIPVLQQLCTLFVSVVRGTPIIVQLYLTYFGIPIFLKYYNFYNGTSYNVNGIPPIIFAIAALGLNQSAFDSETIRAAIQSVEKGQVEAAKSLGMNGLQIFFRVLLPQAVTVAIPSLGNSLIGLVKGTSLAFTCSVVEITAQGKILAGNSYRYFEIYCSLAIIYWVITIFIERLFTYIEKKMSVPEQITVKKEA
nr:amino acid ABC transporter permease [uncultured Clostridium sp.]